MSKPISNKFEDSSCKNNGPKSWETLTEREKERSIARMLDGPAWRWITVDQLLTGDLNRSIIDPQIRRLKRILIFVRDSAFLLEKDKAWLSYFNQARYIYSNERLKLAAEARVLAKQRKSSIAAAMSVPVQVINIYEDFYFDIRDQLAAPIVIRSTVIDASESSGDLMRAYVLSMSYGGGPEVAEYLLDRIGDVGKPHDVATVQGREIEQLELNLLLYQVKEELVRGSRSIELQKLLAARFIPQPLTDIGSAIHGLVINELRRVEIEGTAKSTGNPSKAAGSTRSKRYA